MSTTTGTKTPRRPWTHKEIAFLKSAYPVMSRDEIGRRVGGRSADCVGKKARKLGIASRHFAMTDEARTTLIRLAQAGWSNQEIATALGTNRITVRTHRNRLGIARTPRDGVRYRGRVAAKTREQCEAEGVDSLIELRWEADRIETLRMGYPPEVGTAGAKILGVLKAIGSGTKAEIAKAIGAVEPSKAILSRLVEMGLVVVRKGPIEGHADRRRRNVYRPAKHPAYDPKGSNVGRALGGVGVQNLGVGR